VVPRMVLDRPAGAQGAQLVQPDIELADNPYDRRALVNTLLQRIGQQTPAE
jgi:hypothetical protein